MKVLIVGRKNDITDNKLFVKREICHNESLSRELG